VRAQWHGIEIRASGTTRSSGEEKECFASSWGLCTNKGGHTRGAVKTGALSGAVGGAVRPSVTASKAETGAMNVGRGAGALMLAWEGVDGQCKQVGSTQRWDDAAPMSRIVEVGQPGKLVFKFPIQMKLIQTVNIWKGYFCSSKNFQTLHGCR
jgi:hypothetical protein